MKNLKILLTPQEIDNHVYNLWLTKEFKEAHKDETSGLRRLIKTFMAYPRIFAEMSDKEIEYSHFYSWMNIIAYRHHYTNPYLHDLYYVHEIAHCATMVWEAEMDFYSWFQKITENEFMSALFSEVFIYFFMKKEKRDIRPFTFDHEIWADRFSHISFDNVNASDILKKWYLTEYHMMPPEIRTIISRRKAAVHGFGVNKEKDFIEFQVSRYAYQNYLWCEIWKNDYKKVETALSKIVEIKLKILAQAMSPIKTVTSDHLQKEVENYIEFLNNNSQDDIPFKEHAQVFAYVAKNGNKQYGNLLLNGTDFSVIKQQVLSKSIV